jgi:adenine phosphoribosyltransferase
MIHKDLKLLIREVKDFPKDGVNFYDLTTLFKDAHGFGKVIDLFADHFKPLSPSYVVGIEARGFMIAPVVAYLLGAGFIPVRKTGKLPGKTFNAAYSLEYGEDSLEIHNDAFPGKTPVIIIDDVLATGGTMKATCELVEQLGGIVSGIGVVAELTFLGARAKLSQYPVFSVLSYDR